MNLQAAASLSSFRKIKAGGPGSGRHAGSVGGVAKEHGYSNQMNIGNWNATMHHNPQTNDVIEHYHATDNWTHRSGDAHPNQKFYGMGKGAKALHEHLQSMRVHAS